MTGLQRGGTALAGLSNQTRREAQMWWATSRWWRQALTWSLIIGGLLAGMLWVLPSVLAGVEGAEAARLDLAETAGQFAELAAMVTAVGVVILTQGLLIDDRRAGLTEWLLSKPLSRPALLLAKLLGHTSGLLVAVVAVPWVGVYVLLSVARDGAWPLGPVLGTVGLLVLFVGFHVALVLALSAVTGSRGVVLAVPLALLVGGDLVVAAAPWAVHVSPYVLGRLGAGMLATGELMAVWPLIATLAWTLVLTGAALWRFTRHEL